MHVSFKALIGTAPCASRPFVAGGLDPRTPLATGFAVGTDVALVGRIKIDVVEDEEALLRVSFTVRMALWWRDARLAASPCSRVLPEMLSITPTCLGAASCREGKLRDLTDLVYVPRATFVDGAADDVLNTALQATTMRSTSFELLPPQSHLSWQLDEGVRCAAASSPTPTFLHPSISPCPPSSYSQVEYTAAAPTGPCDGCNRFTEVLSVSLPVDARPYYFPFDREQLAIEWTVPEADLYGCNTLVRDLRSRTLFSSDDTWQLRGNPAIYLRPRVCQQQGLTRSMHACPSLHAFDELMGRGALCVVRRPMPRRRAALWW